MNGGTASDLLWCWLDFVAGGLIAGHAMWGRRWMIDGTAGIFAVYARLWRSSRRWLATYTRR